MKTTLLALILALGSLSHAGVISGGGGKSVVCRNPAGAITSAKTLDLYEGQVLYNLNIANSEAPVAEQIQKALATIPEMSRSLIPIYIDIVQKNMQIVHNMDLQPIDDALVVAVPHGCAAEQLANYFDDKHILVSGDIWDALSKTDQAALVLHEAVYATERFFGATNSQRARHVVASLFDPATKWVENKDGVPKTALTCFAKGGAFFNAFKTGDHEWTLQFQMLGPSYIYTKKTIRVSGNDFDFMEAKTFPILHGDDKIGSSSGSSGEVTSAFENGDAVTITRRWEAIKDINGNAVPGYQAPRYYIAWLSETFPGTSFSELLVNCSVEIP